MQNKIDISGGANSGAVAWINLFMICAWMNIVCNNCCSSYSEGECESFDDDTTAGINLLICKVFNVMVSVGW